MTSIEEGAESVGNCRRCAVCDSKMNDAAGILMHIKQDICRGCMRALHEAGVMVSTQAQLDAWIDANPDQTEPVVVALMAAAAIRR